MNKNSLLTAVRTEIEHAVVPQSFVANSCDLWIRERTWKKDRIYLVSRGSKDTFFINLDVVLPPPPGSPLEFTSLAFVNLPKLFGAVDVAYHASEDADVLLGRIRIQLAGVEDWFARLASPAACLDFLKRSSDKNPESVAYRHCVAHLTAQEP